jgi:amidophosphoribosyltransferase
MDPREDSLKEACGVVGVYAPGEDVARIGYHALLALQHRGEESAGIAVSDGRLITVSKYMGLVSQVFDETTLGALEGHLATGHVRYSTTGSSRWENSQPIYREGQLAVALGHNGNLVNTMELAERLDQNHFRRGTAATTDSDLIAQMIATSEAGSVEDAILEVLPQLRGAFTLTMMDESTVFGCRDPHGFRPLVLGSISGGFVLASETCALTAIGAELIREVQPGEMVAIDSEGIRSHRFAEPTEALCLFEYVYFARADSVLYGRSVQKARFNAGVRLAQEASADADLIMPVPDTGRGAAAGYSKGSGIPYGEGLVRNQYVGRTFIQPTQQMRRQGIRTKLNPMPEMIRGKRLVVVEDSIVRGNTTRQIVHMLRDAGAKEVHMRIASPPIRWPCFYGIDMPTRAELVASEMSVDEIRDYIQADSLAYLSLEGLIASTEGSAETFCTACFSSEYPIPIPETVKVGKHLLEGEIVGAGERSGE